MAFGGCCITRGWVPGGPLTDFGRGRPNLPLPLERVKNGATGICLHRKVLAGVEISTGRPLTDFGRGRPNLPLPSERVKSRQAFEVEGRFAGVAFGVFDDVGR